MRCYLFSNNSYSTSTMFVNLFYVCLTLNVINAKHLYTTRCPSSQPHSPLQLQTLCLNKKYLCRHFLAQSRNHFCRLRILRNTLYLNSGPRHLYFATRLLLLLQKRPHKKVHLMISLQSKCNDVTDGYNYIQKPFPSCFNYQRN